MQNNLVETLMAIVDTRAVELLAIPEDVASRPRAAGKWSPKQIVGHLIDSAVNNHARFVRAQLQDDLVFPGYDQDGWVRVQRYDERSWPELVLAWRTFNTQLAAVMGATREKELTRPRPRHNLHEIGFQPLAAGQEATLAFLMRDYIGHLEHHLTQVLDR
jgi:DinB superfamily